MRRAARVAVRMASVNRAGREDVADHVKLEPPPTERSFYPVPAVAWP